MEIRASGLLHVLHYEQYWFARRLVPLRPLLVAYLNWSVRVELNKIKREALERHARSLASTPAETPGDA